MKCCLDTNVLDWIVDDARGVELLDLVERKRLSAIVAADNAHEIHRIPDSKGERRERLQDLLKSNLLPLTPTHVPISGISRSGLARIATPYVMGLREQLKEIGVIGLDSNHLINASREACAVFVTLDKGILKKREQIRRILAVECLDPQTLLCRSVDLK